MDSASTLPVTVTKAHRIFIPSRVLAGNGNILPDHPAQRAAWVWSPHRGPNETAVVDFSLSFNWPSNGTLRFHVTADQRFQLFIDGNEVSYGPDRCDILHWAVTTLEIELSQGQHRIDARCWQIAEAAGSSRLDPKHADGNINAPNPPMAQMSYQAGFLLAGDSDLSPHLLDTGKANWQCIDRTNALSLTGPKNHGYHDIGPEFHFNMKRWRKAETLKGNPVIVKNPPTFNQHGIRNTGWVLTSTPLPEQIRKEVSPGKIRAIRAALDPEAAWTEDTEVDTGSWQKLIEAGQEIKIPPQVDVELIWDFEQYLCGYPVLVWSGGEDSYIEWSWAESLFEVPQGQIVEAESPRGHRGEINGKRWHGFGDTFQASGVSNELAPALWWRSGRYARLRITTAGEPLTIKHLKVLKTGYPLERKFSWNSSDPEWDAIIPLLATGLEAGAHEVWADSPYYEQMMYVGDNVLHALSNYTCYEDDRLSRRTIELLDWSRGESRAGLIAERYPAAWRQEATTFATLYPSLIKNFLLWRGDTEFVSRHLSGMRQLMESLIAMIDHTGLLREVAGWPFIDWVPDWNQGCGPGVREGNSSIVNLHMVLALDTAAWIENEIGEKLIGQRYTKLSALIFQKIIDIYWDNGRNILLDTTDEKAMTSEHAQVLAVLSQKLSQEKKHACLNALVAGGLNAKCTIYFSYYLLECFYQSRCEDAFFKRLQFWRELPAKGFCSLPEMPDPCRSDSHGWGAHPLYHSFASIAGIRPAKLGFREIAIEPMLGKLNALQTSCVHPNGEIRFKYSKSKKETGFEVELPRETSGFLKWQGEKHPLRPGKQFIKIDQELVVSRNSGLV